MSATALATMSSATGRALAVLVHPSGARHKKWLNEPKKDREFGRDWAATMMKAGDGNVAQRGETETWRPNAMLEVVTRTGDRTRQYASFATVKQVDCTGLEPETAE